MRLLVKKGHSLVNDLRFPKGPIYIGRMPKSHVFLPDRSVSRQHAVMLKHSDGNWTIQDLDSANRTLVNGRLISNLPLHEGDVISIADFTMEIHFDDQLGVQAQEKPIDLGDTLMPAETVIPGVYSRKAKRPPLQMLHVAPARIKDLYQLCAALCGVEDQESFLAEMTEILLAQFDAYHVWAGLRETTSGPLSCHGGLTRGGAQVALETLHGRKIVNRAVRDEAFLLMPNLADLANSSTSSLASLAHLRSAMAAPIMGPAGAYGVIYLDNGIDHPSYTNFDLDYLTIVTTLVAALLERTG